MFFRRLKAPSATDWKFTLRMGSPGQFIVMTPLHLWYAIRSANTYTRLWRAGLCQVPIKVEDSTPSSSPSTIMNQVFTYKFDTPTFKGTTRVNTSLFINGKFTDPIEGGSIEYVFSCCWLLRGDWYASVSGLLTQVRRIQSFNSDFSTMMHLSYWKSHHIRRRRHQERRRCRGQSRQRG